MSRSMSLLFLCLVSSGCIRALFYVHSHICMHFHICMHLCQFVCMLVCIILYSKLTKLAILRFLFGHVEGVKKCGFDALDVSFLF